MNTAWKIDLWFATDALVRKLRPARLQIAARAVRSGVCVGLASPELLVAVDEAAYARGRYAYHGTDAHDLRGLFPWEEKAIEAWFPSSGRVLVTSAGGGREVVALRRRGYAVEAIECNEQLRARANALLARVAPGAPIQPTPRDRCAAPPGPYDAAVVGWGAYTFIRGAARRQAFLAELAAQLRPGAPVLISFFARTGDPRRFRIAHGIATGLGRISGREPAELGDLADPTWQHYVARAELESEARGAGLELLCFQTEGYGHGIARRAGPEG